MNGVEFTPETVCVFDGVQNVLEKCNSWYEERLNEDKVKELVREDEREVHKPAAKEDGASTGTRSRNSLDHTDVDHAPSSEMPPGVHFFIAEPIVDRKSSFIGRACRISDPSQVRLLCLHDS